MIPRQAAAAARITALRPCLAAAAELASLSLAHGQCAAQMARGTERSIQVSGLRTIAGFALHTGNSRSTTPHASNFKKDATWITRGELDCLIGLD